MVFFFVVLFLFLVIGLLNFSNVKTLQDFGLSKNYFSTFFSTMTIVASFVGGGVILGTIEKTLFTQSFYAFYGLLGYVLQLILTGVLFSKKIVNKKHFLSIGDFFYRFYGRKVQIFVGLLWVIFTLGIITVQVKGLGQIISSISEVSLPIAIFIGGSVTTLYCYFGGFRAVVRTDAIQCILMLLIIPGVALYFIKTQDISLMFNTKTLVQNTFSEEHALEKILSAFFGFLLGDTLIPPVIQRILMCSTEKQARISMIWGSVLSFILILSATLIGLNIPSIGQENFSQNLSSFLESYPSYFSSLFYIALFSTLISTADTYINAASISWAQDVVRPEKDIYGSIKQAKFATLFFGVAGMLLASYVESIFDFLLLLYKVWGPFVVVPFIGILYKKVISSSSLVILFITSSCILILWNYMDIETITGISDLCPSIVASFFVFFIAKKQTFGLPEKK